MKLPIKSEAAPTIPATLPALVEIPPAAPATPVGFAPTLFSLSKEATLPPTLASPDIVFPAVPPILSPT
jgi:hypothetical protein